MRVETAGKIFWIDSLKRFIDDISPKRIQLHQKELIFNVFNFYAGKILSITCAGSLWKYLIFTNSSEQNIFHLNL